MMLNSPALLDRYANAVLACHRERPGRPFEIIVVTRPHDPAFSPTLRIVWKRKPRKGAIAVDTRQDDLFA